MKPMDVILKECDIVFEDAETCSISYGVPEGKTLYINSDIYHERGLTIDRLTDINLTMINGKEYNLDNLDFFEIR